MDNRFTLKDFIFVVLLLAGIGLVILSMAQFSYQEQALQEVRDHLKDLSALQKQQTAILSDIRSALRNGVRVSDNGQSATNSATLAESGPATTTADAHPGRIRRRNPDGSIYVYYPDIPTPPRDPRTAPDYAQGDWLIDNIDTEPQLLTPLIEKDYSATLTQGFVLETLVTRNPQTFEFEPLLAESYEQKADKVTFVFKLRSNITFSDGTPITADDVLFSYQTAMTDGIDDAPLRSFMSTIKSCRKLDDRTIEFVFVKPYFQALETAGGLYIIPKHIYQFKTPEEYNSRSALLVGSGPYKLGKNGWERGQQITLVRNDNYWGEKPTFDRVVLKFISNPQAAFQSFLAGELDVHAPDPDQFVANSANPDFVKKYQVYKFPRPNAGYVYLGYNLTKPIFKDAETREALTMLIDREAIIKTFLKGLAMEITSPFSPLSPQNDPTIKPWPYDPDAAKKKLAEAGWKPNAEGVLERDGIPFRFSVSMGSGNPIGERIVTYIKDQFAKAGIDMAITPYEFSVLVERINQRNFDALMLAWSGSVEEDPYQIWHSDSIANRGSNAIGYSNPAADKLIEEARAELDETKRMKLWHQWQAIIHHDQPYTFLYSRLDRAFIANRFKNTEPYKVGLSEPDWYVPADRQKYR